MTKEKKISWKILEVFSSQLAIQLEHYNDEKIDLVIALGRGGLVIGDIVSRVLKTPMGVLMLSSYNKKRIQKEIQGSVISSVFPVQGNILIIDDLIDSGKTMQYAINYIKSLNGVKNVKTATIFVKEGSPFEPDQFVSYCQKKFWLSFPYEKFDKEEK